MGPLPRCLGFVKGRDLAAGQVDLLLGRGKGGVGTIDLSWMDQRFAVEPHVAPLFAFVCQPALVHVGVVNTIDDDATIGLCSQQAQAQRRHHRNAVGAEARVQFLGQVIGAHDHALEFRVRRDRTRIQHPDRGLHHRPDRQVASDLGQCVKVSGAIDLGQQDAIRIHLRDRLCIGTAPLGIEPVDPDNPGPVAIAALRKGIRKSCARRGFFLGRNGIFEVKDDGIHRKAPRLVQRPWLGSGNVKNGTVGAEAGVHRDVLGHFVAQPRAIF